MNAIARDAGSSSQAWAKAVAYRPEVSSERLALIVSGFFTLSCHNAFWRAVIATGALHGPGGWLTGVSLLVSITALNMTLLCLLLNRWTAKPVLTVLLLVTAVAVHFMDQYTIYFDDDMIRNVLHTDRKESAELVSLGLIWALFLRGVLPVVLLWRVRVKARSMRRALLIRSAWLGVATAVAAGGILLSFQNLSALMRNHREVRHLITPGNYLVSLGRVLLDDGSVAGKPRTPIGVGAKVVGRAPASRPRLLVLVIGETVRAQNWGLNGYARQTTPQLAQIDPVNFGDVTACGSSTEVSLPCMFSPYGRRHYDKDRIQHSQSLLHVLEHAGIPTLWRDNQTGCKGVCDGLAFESFEHARDPQLCDSEGCLDEILLRGLAEEIGNRSGDMVVVLHQLGNHGPRYFRRYPQRSRRYVPACETSELGQCRPSEIVNAYDNAVLYTDEFLARTIHFLATQTDRDTALIYLSDHGESLGEHGLFLHGMPYAIAPKTQVKVPMMMWASSGFVAGRGIDMQCLKSAAILPASHDNLFHSVLGLMQVQTPEYDSDLDLIHRCSVVPR